MKIVKLKVDILIITTSQCHNQPRIEKMLWHYAEQLGYTVGVFCMSMTDFCARASGENVFHQTVTHAAKPSSNTWLGNQTKKLNYLKAVLKLVRRMQIGFKPTVIQGCNLDGFIISRIAFPGSGRNIFELWDNFSTMNPKYWLSKVEGVVMSSAKTLILPTRPLFEQSTHPRKILLQNSVDKGLAEKHLARASVISNLPQNFILSGGTQQGSCVLELADLVARSDSLCLVVAAPRPQDVPLSSRVTWVGYQDWGSWLELVRASGCVWVWYDSQVLHYQKNLSPNKYWEACLFWKPLIVNTLSQFVDRIDSEPEMLEIGEFRDNPKGAEEKIVNLGFSQNPDTYDPNIEFWIDLEHSRKREIRKMMEFLRHSRVVGSKKQI